MNIFELFRLAFGSLLRNRLRSLLTILGIVIGVGAVVALVSFGQSYQNYVNSQFQNIGSNSLFVSSTNPTGPNAKTVKVKPLTMGDAAAIANPQYVSGVSAVAPTFNLNATVAFNSKTMSVQITGGTDALATVRDYEISDGRFLTSTDVSTSAMVAVLGSAVVTKLFPDGENPIGQTIRINNLVFTVIGTTVAKSGGFGNQDQFVAIPITTAQTRMGSTNARTSTGEYRVSSIALTTTSADVINTTRSDITALLSDRHQIQYVGAEDFTVSSQGNILTAVNSVLSTITLFLGLIAGISLLVGGIGVMNIMLVTVTERTREIGLRKAVGAKFTDLLSQFLIESVTLCTIGGLLGVALGFAIELIGSAALPQLKLAISTPAVILAVSVSTAIGVFFGLYPASRAASLKPIEALRYE